jgi:hypothetical protein
MIIVIRELIKKSLSVPQASKVESCKSKLEVVQSGGKAVASTDHVGYLSN